MGSGLSWEAEPASWRAPALATPAAMLSIGGRQEPCTSTIPVKILSKEASPRIARAHHVIRFENAIAPVRKRPWGSLIICLAEPSADLGRVTPSYERVYMGATYRFNPEDTTAFRMLPVTDSDYYLVCEIKLDVWVPDLSGLVQQLGMVKRTDELSRLPVLSDKETLHQHGPGVFAILLQRLSAHLPRAHWHTV
jgi:hypothetical protein